MRLRGWLWLAVSSLFISASLRGALRPHYGGTLTVELSNADGQGGNALSMPIAETLVRWQEEFVPIVQNILSWEGRSPPLPRHRTHASYR